jgi:hypothetical protein
MRYVEIDKGEFFNLMLGFCAIVFSFILAETIYYEIKKRKQNRRDRKRGEKNL